MIEEKYVLFIWMKLYKSDKNKLTFQVKMCKLVLVNGQNRVPLRKLISKKALS